MVSGWENTIRACGNLTKGKGQGQRQGWDIPMLGDMGVLCQIGLAVKAERWWFDGITTQRQTINIPPFYFI